MKNNIDIKLQEFMALNGFDFMDSYQDEKTGEVKENYRKGDEDITIIYLINKDNL